MDETQVAAFRRLSDETHAWTGFPLRAWHDSTFQGVATGLPSEAVSRENLKTICADPAISDREVLGAVMAWGRMRARNARALAGAAGPALEVVRTLRAGGLSRLAAYEQFRRLRTAGALPGVRPAYYTKLIFFCAPRHDGYIMDQWTAKSVNLIAGRGLVAFDYGGYVSDANDARVYDAFCELVEALAARDGRTPEETEMRLFSRGGRRKGRWRQHVIDHWPRAGNSRPVGRRDRSSPGGRDL